MNNKSHCRLAHQLAATDMKTLQSLIFAALCVLTWARPALAGDAPQWMHAVVSAPLPSHDEKTDAVLLYSERSVNVQSVDKIKTPVSIAYKILRPSGRDYGVVRVWLNAHSKINGLRGWCIPAQGKDYE